MNYSTMRDTLGLKQFLLSILHVNEARDHVSCLNDKVWSLTKLKAFADNKFTAAEMMMSLFDWVDKHCGKSRKWWLPAFSTFPSMFSKGFLYRVAKIVIVWQKG